MNTTEWLEDQTLENDLKAWREIKMSSCIAAKKLSKNTSLTFKKTTER